MRQVDDSEDSENEHEPQYGFSGYKDNAVSRMYIVNPKEGKNYYLRMLVHHEREAKSFEIFAKLVVCYVPRSERHVGKEVY